MVLSGTLLKTETIMIDGPEPPENGCALRAIQSVKTLDLSKIRIFLLLNLRRMGSDCLSTEIVKQLKVLYAALFISNSCLHHSEI